MAENGEVDVRLPGKGNSNSHGARPVHLIITMSKWFRTSRLSIKNSLSLAGDVVAENGDGNTPFPPLGTPYGPRHMLL